ncbi:uncharacterized protein ACLA_097010 [Aspergillus clavatus NRRL 1]|uniref:Uncharacterized protein n=1 Tax=Aspergillus clavatus (strain ATCC 1007 / CBS 513.65 / DSM 816 / NCTC 3887 / NRRL 1 / QM 1276 / 107) TaxID=344612 RepID=A1CMH9_ASPCL|nr:uncharacterized protein ACLA_097010 [Aspergillus clavatus NRRL 1]EAW08766.1 conserved hypothetical protein [Aspergillus clavatus NRRL 1]
MTINILLFQPVSYGKTIPLCILSLRQAECLGSCVLCSLWETKPQEANAMAYNGNFVNPMTTTELDEDSCVLYQTGYRPNQEGQRTWWVWIPLVGTFGSDFQLLGAMIESIARGHASLAPNWDRTSAGGVWYDFDCASDILDEKTLFGLATDDLQNRLENEMASSVGHAGQKPAMGFR